MTKRLVTSALATILLSLSLVGCSDNQEPRTVECDAGDQLEHDSDCGYYDDQNNWVWYNFVVLGQTTTGQATMPAHDEEKSHKKPKPKKTKATKKSAPKATPKNVVATKK